MIEGNVPSYEDTLKEKRIARIKAVGQEIIDRADEIATGSLMTGMLSISAYLSMEGGAAVDTIEWSTEVVNKNAFKVMNNIDIY